MIYLKFDHELAPCYMTTHSAAADLKARHKVTIEPMQRVKVATGVWIDYVDWSQVPQGLLPELQIRARSGLAFKRGLTMANGIGTVDVDYRDEIAVLLINLSQETQTIMQGERIAQMALNLVARFPSLEVGGTRQGGFGSTSS